MLSKEDIQKELGKGINISPLHLKNIKENSINFTLSKNAWTLGNGVVVKNTDDDYMIGPVQKLKTMKNYNKGDLAVIYINKKPNIIMLPHSTTIVETQEVIGVEKYIGGEVHSKVGMANRGIGHIGTMIGPCFCGHLMIALHNVTNELIILPVGETFISITFEYLDTPYSGNKNCNISGHVDKLSELGIKIDPMTREYLTEDWKCSIESIRRKMIESSAYCDYKNKMKKIKFQKFTQFFSMKNIIRFLIIIFIIAIGGAGAYYLDNRYDNTVWSERFWTLISAGIILPLMKRLSNGLFKKNI